MHFFLFLNLKIYTLVLFPQDILVRRSIGNSFASDKTSTASIETSIFPVFKSKFSVPLDLLSTLPLILVTLALFSKIGKKLFIFNYALSHAIMVS